MTGRNRQLGRNIASMYLPRVLAAATSFFLFPFIASHVGLQDYGTWLLLSSTATFFLLDFGMSVSVTRYVAEADATGDSEAISRVISTSLAFFAALGLALGAVFLAAMVLLLPSLNIPDENRDLAFLLVCLLVGSSFVLGMPLSVFRTAIAGVHRYDVTNVLVLVQLSIRATLIVLLLLGGAGILAVALVEALSATAMAIAGVVLAYRFVPGLTVSPRLASFALLKSMTPYSAQLFVMGLCALVVLQADSVIIGAFLSATMVTLYAAAFRLYTVCRELTGSAMRALIPDASRSGALGHSERLKKMLVRGTKYSNAMLLLVGLPVAVFAAPLLTIWAGEQFSEVANVTQLLIASLAVNNLHLIAASLLTGVGRIGTFAKLHVVWATSNIALSVLLVQSHGLVGVALGTAIPIVCLEPLYLRAALREFGVPAKRFLLDAVAKAYLPAAVAATPLVAVVLLADPRGLPAILGLWLVYAVLFSGMLLRWSLDDDELGRLKRMAAGAARRLRMPLAAPARAR